MKELILFSCVIVLSIALMIVFPFFVQGKLVLDVIDIEYFHAIKLNKSAFLFRGVGGKKCIYYDVKNYGIIRPMLAIQIIGYLLAILSILLALTMIFAFNIRIYIVVIVVGSLFLSEVLTVLIVVDICGNIRKKRKSKS